MKLLNKENTIERKLNENEIDGDIEIYMNTWANYNENGADLSRYGIKSISDGWMTVDEAKEFAEKYAEDEPFINDIDNYSGIKLNIDEYSNTIDSLDLIERINNLDKHDKEILGAIMEAQGGELEDAFDVLERGDYEWYSGIDSYDDLAYELIDQLGGISELSDPENYIDDEALRRDLSYDIDYMMRDDAEDAVRNEHPGEDDEDYDFEKEVEDYIDENREDYLDMWVEDILNEPSKEDIERYFDYEKWGRDLSFDGYVITDNGVIRID